MISKRLKKGQRIKKLLNRFIVLALFLLIFILVSDAATSVNLLNNNIVETSTRNFISMERFDDGLSNNIFISLPKESYTVGDTVPILVGGVMLDNSVYLDIYLMSDESESFRYLGAINEEISFIPQKIGRYNVKVSTIIDGVAVILSQKQFIVNESTPDISSMNSSHTNNDLVAGDVLNTDPLNTGTVSKQTDINGSMGSPIPRNFTSVKSKKFSGATTEFYKYSNNISKLRHLSDVVLENSSSGKIRWHNSLNVLNMDLDSNVRIEDNLIYVNSNFLDSSFNSAATLTIYNIYVQSPVILRNNVACTTCSIISYIDGIIEFNVIGFSAYTVVENTSLGIWDNNEEDDIFYEGNLTKYVNQNINFFANYTNRSDNSSITGADCSIIFSTNYSQVFSMTYDSNTGLYIYTRSFDTNDTYQYNISCNMTGFYSLNLSDDLFVDFAGDLVVYPEEITFSNNYPTENETITIYSIIHNILDYNYTDVNISFYDGAPSDNGVLISDTIINISGLSDVETNATWTSKVGTHNIYVSIDLLNNKNDLDRENNNAYNTTFTSLWQIFYGNILSSTSNLGSSSGVFINWSMNVGSRANIYVTSSGANINWMALEAISKNTSGGEDSNTVNDFTDIDRALGIENYTDSINLTYTFNNYPVGFSNYSVYHVSIRDVPEVMSTNNTNFYTGILWDTSDTVLPYYTYESDLLLRPDVVFVAKTNHDQIGAYGIYDYEIRVPAYLRNYKNDGGLVQFYYEIQ